MSKTKGLVKFAGKAPSNDGAALRILLIDDDSDYGKQLEELLENRPGTAFEVELVPDLNSAIPILSHPAPADVILLDLDLPDSRGIETALMVLQSAEYVPVVILAHSENQRAAWEATQYGAQDVILRDQMTPEVLVWALKHAVEQHLLRSSLERHVRELELTNGRFLSLVVDNADAIVVVDRIGVVRFVNPSAEALLRCSAGDLMGEMFGVPLEGIDTTEIDLRGRRGSGRTAEIRVMRTLWDGQRAFIVTLRDVTERKKSELALKLAKQTAEQANAMKSQFLANMSHELRTPLNAIIGYSEMMMMGINGQVEPERYRGYIRDIHTGGKHLLSLINDLLDLSKAESGQLALTEEPFDLVVLAESTVDLLSGQAETKGLNLLVTAEARSIWINADERLFKQVLMNLVSNSLKFTPKGGRIVVSIDRTFSGDTRVVVKDNGIGIPKDQIPRAFAAFVQIENAYTRSESAGTGLGLALTKRFIELHQGKISVESDSGAGTMVTVLLPKARSLAAGGQGGEVVSMASSAPSSAQGASNQ